MKFLTKLILLVIIFAAPLKASAYTFNVLVLPVDLYSVCSNYYCFDEVSNIIAEDVISNFNSSGSIASPTLYTIRAKLNSNPALKMNAANVLKRYSANEKSFDFTSMKALSEAFSVKSILVISNSVTTDKSRVRRNLWEMLELSTAFEIVYPYEMRTDAVLIDTVNGVVMWSGNFKRKVGNNNSQFHADSPSQARVKLEQIKYYSKEIAAKSIAQNVTLRFFPKTINPVFIPKKGEQPEIGSFFRQSTPVSPKASGTSKSAGDSKKGAVEEEKEGDYGEMIYGL